MTPAPSPVGGRNALVHSLAHSRSVLDRLLYAHTQLRLLLEAGESRFLGRALDELADAEEEMERAEAMTADTAVEVAIAAGLRGDSDMLELINSVPDDMRQVLVQLRTAIQDLLVEVNAERASARSLSHALVANRSSGGGRQT